MRPSPPSSSFIAMICSGIASLPRAAGSPSQFVARHGGVATGDRHDGDDDRYEGFEVHGGFLVEGCAWPKIDSGRLPPTTELQSGDRRGRCSRGFTRSDHRRSGFSRGGNLGFGARGFIDLGSGACCSERAGKNGGVPNLIFAQSSNCPSENRALGAVNSVLFGFGKWSIVPGAVLRPIDACEAIW